MTDERAHPVRWIEQLYPKTEGSLRADVCAPAFVEVYAPFAFDPLEVTDTFGLPTWLAILVADVSIHAILGHASAIDFLLGRGLAPRQRAVFVVEPPTSRRGLEGDWDIKLGDVHLVWREPWFVEQHLAAWTVDLGLETPGSEAITR